jgi:hypothetical protein
VTDTPNSGIPYVPENTLDPAAGLNLSLDVIDALLQTAVISMSLTSPPGSPDDGDLYIPATPATGAWSGLEDHLVRYRTEGAFWQSFAPGTRAKLVLNLADGRLFTFDPSSTSTGWNPLGVQSGSPVVTEAGANVDATADNAGNYTRFTHASPTYSFDDAESYAVGAEYHGRYAGAGSLIITPTTGMTINPPSGGSLEIPPGGTFTIKIVASDEADLIGVTVAAS